MSQLRSVRVASAGKARAELVVVGCFEGQAPDTERLKTPAANAVRRSVERTGWRGREGQVVRAQASEKKSELVTVHGLGRRQDFDARKLLGWLQKLTADADREGYGEMLVALPDHPSARGRMSLAILLRLFLSGYRFDRFRGERSRGRLRVVRVLPPAGEESFFRKALRISRQLAHGVAFGRDLANTPPNQASPQWMAAEARELARSQGMKIRILGPKELESQGMGGILAVGGGSANAPRLVRLEWGEGSRSVALVGKGVTFDTGGISIKPSRGMDEMKYDKSGACAVLGIARAAAELDLPVRFRAYLPLAENMPDGASYRPGDIVRCYNGKTVEVLNTDAEGRMILADALSWAAEEKPDTLLEFSTLTGACVVALGHHGAGLYSPHDELAAELLEAAESSGERLWRMPLWPEFREEMKGHHGDLRNVAGRWGGANTAAAFLSHFVGEVRRWAHLDIAGTAYLGGDQKGSAGATGFGIALTTDWLLRATRLF
ncbi:MAG: leucyl aminopeptidase [Thermoanaerobaculia bacterium]